MNAAELQGYLAEIISAFSILNANIGLISGAVLIVAVLLLLLAVSRLYQKRFIAAGLHGCIGMCCLGGTIIILLLALNIHTYQRLTYEKPIARLIFAGQGPQQYRVTLVYLDEQRDDRRNQEQYSLSGDEWQLDARVLRWKPVLQMLGLNAMYRLERLHGRYTAVSEELSRDRTVYALAEDQGLDIWTLTQRYRQWLDWIDAYYGSAAYMPMADGAAFTVVINQSGLLARPDNAIAEQLLRGW